MTKIPLFKRTPFLDKAIGVVCPIHGISVTRADPVPVVRIDFKAEATDEQRAAAQTVLDAFDWSDEAQEAREG